MKNIHPWIVCLLTVISVFIVSCNKNSNTESNNEPENNAIDITFTPTDTSVNLNLFYINLKEITLVNVLVNEKPIAYKIITDESLSLAKNSLNLGRNKVRFIYSRNKVLDTIQKDFFNTITLHYSVQNTFKHHADYFTEGLFFDASNNLVESMGLEGKSKIVFYNTSQDSFKVKDSIVNENVEFGEGVALQNGNLIQLLWKNNYLKIYDYPTKKLIKKLDYDSEGWGLCTNQNVLYASNGTNTISIIDVKGAKTQIVKSIQVHDQNGPVTNLNELEFINGIIYANVWQSNFVYLIDPGSGDVIGKIDFTGLVEKEHQLNMEVDVINGIAFNKTNNTLLVTGKYWNYFYEIKLMEALPSIIK